MLPLWYLIWVVGNGKPGTATLLLYLSILVFYKRCCSCLVKINSLMYNHEDRFRVAVKNLMYKTYTRYGYVFGVF